MIFTFLVISFHIYVVSFFTFVVKNGYICGNIFSHVVLHMAFLHLLIMHLYNGHLTSFSSTMAVFLLCWVLVQCAIQGVSEKTEQLLFSPIFTTLGYAHADGRKIFVTSGIEIAQNDRQVKNQNLFKLNELTSLMLLHHRAPITQVILTLQQMGF